MIPANTPTVPVDVYTFKSVPYSRNNQQIKPGDTYTIIAYRKSEKEFLLRGELVGFATEASDGASLAVGIVLKPDNFYDTFSINCIQRLT